LHRKSSDLEMGFSMSKQVAGCQPFLCVCLCVCVRVCPSCATCADAWVDNQAGADQQQNPVQDDGAGGGRTAQLVDLAMQVFMHAHKNTLHVSAHAHARTQKHVTRERTRARTQACARTNARGTSRTPAPLSPSRPSSPAPLSHCPHTQVQLNGIDVAEVVKENGVRQADGHLAPASPGSVGSGADSASGSATAASKMSAAPPAQQPPPLGVFARACMRRACACVRACVRA
jgi:hypothetical protein